MPESQAQTPAQKMIGDFAPKLVSPDFRCIVWRCVGAQGTRTA